MVDEKGLAPRAKRGLTEATVGSEPGSHKFLSDGEGIMRDRIPIRFATSRCLTMNIQFKIEFLNLKNEISFCLEQGNLKQNNHLQNYLYFIYYPLFSFVESMFILCEHGKHQSAKVLLRSVLEAHINIIYHQLGNTEQRLALSAKKGFDSKITIINDIRTLIGKYPNLKSDNPSDLFSTEWLEKCYEWAAERRKNIVELNHLASKDKDPDLISKAIKCDEATIPGVEQGHFQKMYSTIYRQLSPASHLNIEGVQTFVSRNETGEYLFDDGSDGDFSIALAVEICVAFVKDLYEHKALTGPLPQAIQKLDTMLAQQGLSLPETGA